MARNIEIKARIESIALIFPKASAIAENGPIEIIQIEGAYVDLLAARP